MVTFATSQDRPGNAQYVRSLLSARVFTQFGGNGERQMVYVLILSCLWAAVGALVFFVPAAVSLPHRLGLTIVTSLVFGAVGWVDVSSIYHTIRSDPTVIAKESFKPDVRTPKAAN